MFCSEGFTIAKAKGKRGAASKTRSRTHGLAPSSTGIIWVALLRRDLRGVRGGVRGMYGMVLESRIFCGFGERVNLTRMRLDYVLVAMPADFLFLLCDN